MVVAGCYYPGHGRIPIRDARYVPELNLPEAPHSLAQRFPIL
jgi:hypothetical protein